jgi:RHS repeat-associated protein
MPSRSQIRMTLNENSNIVSAQDYYPYGEILRSYTLGIGATDKYKFTEKERDTETNYDYFGARYYDSELARWLQVDPMSTQRPGLTPYNYCQNNPLLRIDPTGMLDNVYLNGTEEEQKEALTAMQSSTSLSLSINEVGKLSATGDAITDSDKALLEAINNQNVDVNLTITSENQGTDINGNQIDIVVGAYAGNFQQGGKVITKQIINLNHADKLEKIGGGTVGQSIMHEILESYGGATISNSDYNKAHAYSLNKLPLPDMQILINMTDLFNQKIGIQVGNKRDYLYTKKINPLKK